MQDLVETIIEQIKERRYVSFVEVENMCREHIEIKGDVCMHLPGYPNVILWAYMSEAFYEVVQAILENDYIQFKSAEFMSYLIDGAYLNMPLAKSLRQYKKPHWLPVTFDIKEESSHS